MTCYDEFEQWLMSSGLRKPQINKSISEIEKAYEDGFLDLSEWAYRNGDDEEWYEIDEDIVEWIIDYCEYNII